MKRNLLALLVISFITFAFAQDPLVNIPDANFKAYLVGNADININGDNEIQVSEAQAYTGIIKCNSKNISSLIGIEEFVNITELNCHTNNLINLDISKNTALTNLNCHTNNLNSLDISKNIALINVRCNINNLTSLDISKNTALTNLNCHTNNLTSLDLSLNTALTQIYCNINNLSSLDVSQNVALTRLHCNGNNLISLNVKNGNNVNFSNFNTTNNPNLFCIDVDDVAWSTQNWTNIDAQTTFSENCAEFLSKKAYYNLTNISVYPNPVNDMLYFTTNTAIENVSVSNMLGQKIDTNLSSDNKNLDMSNLAKGNYLVKVTIKGVSKTFKVAKQ